MSSDTTSRSFIGVIGVIGFGAFGRLMARHLYPQFPAVRL